ncbi:uncharacterized protein LOC130511465 [Raphanus sativus]|uniref:Uncharacterized protein LOC108854697 n=1 Tax=Raphanus sativus TaxID=3726 RepID=A0A6J0NGY9_RAPSA|nr:uncharacterized protein LOC108854697 [Raphanus sativus]XP_056864449.1 uncharacterized protein LOC130511465 [Raphanus sativus]
MYGVSHFRHNSPTKIKRRILLDIRRILSSPIMISVVIITELLVEYTTALAKLTAGILPRRRGDNDVIRIGGFSLRFPARSTPVPDFSSHLVDF